MFPHLIGRRGPGAYVATAGSGGGTGTGIGDGGSVEPPVVTTNASGDVTVKGKVKPGSFGKIIVPLATVQAGRRYTFRYTPHFQQLAQQGKLAMVGFGFKNNNDFHIVGLRGDGTTGLHKYKVYGTPPNGWNKDSGHTTSDGGASANGTQAGPNYIRILISADGTTYTFSTSPDNVTYTDEYTGAALSPFANVSGVVNFGLALWFNNADAGVYSIAVDQIADAVPAFQFAGTQVDTAAASTTFTFPSVPIGPADANRRVYAVFTVGGATTNISSVTIGGITATRAIDGSSTTIGRQAIYYADVPTGTTATIVITTSAACTTCICSVYKTTIANLLLLDAVSNFDNNTTLALTDLSVAPGGFVLVQARDAATALSIAYNGIDTPVQDDLRTSGLIQALSKSFLTTEGVDTNDFTITTTPSVALFGVAASFFVSTVGTLNPIDKDSSINLSNVNLKATRVTAGSSWCSVRSTTSHSSGKYYYEWMPNEFSGSFIGAGFGNAAASLASYLGSSADSIAIVTDGNVYKSAGATATLSGIAEGDLICIAIDLGADLFWCRKGAGNWNNNGSANPATGVGGIALPSGLTSGAVFAGLSVQTGPNDAGTANFGGSAFGQTPPSGFSAWG